jgi:uncharacterized hydrophobic protein (TIGR00271 family)
MPAISVADLARMRDQLFFDGPDAARKLTRFWILLLLAAVIASAGVVADSTATVIGAMIVAPLMVPILGTVLSVVTGDVVNLARSLALVLAGSLVVVAVGYVLATAVTADIVSATSSQVAGRVSPRLVDLLAALATGVVGAFALVRSDVSDTLPGVAIAISLVPPLAVVGITLEAGAGGEAIGALLLFLTNVVAILLSGLVVMALYRVGRVAGRDTGGTVWNAASIAVVVAVVLALATPLAATSTRIALGFVASSDVSVVATDWAEPAGWRIDVVEPERGQIVVRAAGPLPAPAADDLRRALDDAGLRDVDVRLVLTPEQTIDLEGS